MSTTEIAPPRTKGGVTFEKLGFRPWTVDILENTLEEEELENTSPLGPMLLDTVQIPSPKVQNSTASILIGGFLDTAQLYTSPHTNSFAPKMRIHETGARMQAQEEFTILKERVAKLESILKTERALRTLLEEKLLCYRAC